MQRATLGLGLLLVNLICSLALPLEKTTQSNVTDDDASQLVMGETQVSSASLNLKPHIEQSKSAELNIPITLEVEEEERHETPSVEESAKTEPDVDIENDYSFLPDKMPELTDDEYLEIGDDGTPFNYLKGRDNKRLVMPQKLPAASSPIYITVPIYINTAAGIPLQLSIGGQQVPLTPAKLKQSVQEPLAPITNVKEASPTTSQFNRLLNHDDNTSSISTTKEQQKTSLRGSNRHRSNIGIKYGRHHEQVSPPASAEYRNIGAYSIYI